MNQLSKLKLLLGNPDLSDEVLQFYLDNAKEIICDLRNSLEIESKYSTIQIKMAIEMFNKRGAEGQLAHSENGIARTYESAEISKTLLGQITPVARTPFSKVRMV